MKNLKYLLPIILIMGVFVTGCSQGVHDPAQVQKDLDNNNSLFTKAFNSKDITGVMTFYTENPEILPPNFHEVKGKENVKNFWQQGMNIYSDLSLQIDTVDVVGNTTIETGSYSVNVQMPDQPVMTDNGKYLVVWKYGADGSWKIDKDIFNSNMPPPEMNHGDKMDTKMKK